MLLAWYHLVKSFEIREAISAFCLLPSALLMRAFMKRIPTWIAE
jgi:hypothetical protein